jgi:hypothetical protein
VRTAPPYLHPSPVSKVGSPGGVDSTRARHERRLWTYRGTAALSATLVLIATVVGASLDNASAVTRMAVACVIAVLAGVAVYAYAAATDHADRAR